MAKKTTIAVNPDEMTEDTPVRPPVGKAIESLSLRGGLSKDQATVLCRGLKPESIRLLAEASTSSQVRKIIDSLDDKGAS